MMRWSFSINLWLSLEPMNHSKILDLLKLHHHMLVSMICYSQLILQFITQIIANSVQRQAPSQKSQNVHNTTLNKWSVLNFTCLHNHNAYHTIKQRTIFNPHGRGTACAYHSLLKNVVAPRIEDFYWMVSETPKIGGYFQLWLKTCLKE